MLVVDAQLDAGQEPDRVFHPTGEWDPVIGDVRRAESLIGMPVREIHERPAAAPVVRPGGVGVVVYDRARPHADAGQRAVAAQECERVEHVLDGREQGVQHRADQVGVRRRRSARDVHEWWDLRERGEHDE